MEHVSSLNQMLKEELQTIETERESLSDFQAELEHLLSEKLHHVEQLRQIHSDINMVSSL